MIIKKINPLEESKESNLFYKCLKSWVKDPDLTKKDWARTVEELKVYVALAGDKQVGFMQVVPIEKSHVSGANMHFIQCMLISPFENGPGNRQKQGIGEKLLNFVIEDLQTEPKDAIVATSMAYFGEEVTRWFEKRGFERIDRKPFVSFEEIEYETILWIPYADVEKPKFIEQVKEPDFNKNSLVIFSNGWCRSCNSLANLARRVAKEYGLEIIEISTLNRENYLEYGIMDGIYFNNQPVSYDGNDYETNLRNSIEGELNK